MATGTLMITFDARNILDLLCHYTSGSVPLGCTLNSFGISPILNRHVGMEVVSDQWADPEISESDLKDKRDKGGLAPLIVRYEGKKVLSWGDKHAPVVWKDADTFEGQRS